MFKKIVLLIVVLLVISGALFAQDRAKNSIALSFGFIGAELSYERIFNRYLSVLGDVSFTTLVFVYDFSASAKTRVYPFGGAFFLDLGMGYTYSTGMVAGFGSLIRDMILTVFTFGYWLKKIDMDDYKPSGGFLFQPGLGWKIDVGKPDGFVLPISMGLDIKVNKKHPDFMPYLRIGVGYSF